MVILLILAASLTLNPAMLNPAVTQATLRETVCTHGWTATVRPPPSYTTALKRRQLAAMGLPHARLRAYEEDHHLSLGLGGNPTAPENLRPERWPEAHRKDKDEVRLMHAVCHGRTTLQAAQEELLRRWP